LAGQKEHRKSAHHAQIDLWRLRIYSAGFVVAFALHLAISGIGRYPALLIISVAAISFGLWKAQGPWLRVGVTLGILHALAFPILQEAAANGDSLANIIKSVPVWPQLLVTLIGSRVLAIEGKLSFTRFWHRPTEFAASVEIQSVPSAIALGAFLTLVFYRAVPHALTPSGRQTSDIVISAMLGGTFVHSAIIFLFFVILASILNAVQSHLLDRSIVTSFGHRIGGDRNLRAARNLSLILADEFGRYAHTRAFRLLSAAIETVDAGERVRLAALSFDGFQSASRQFVRALLPLLPLLGFLGTVIGLTTAIAELPRGLASGGDQAFDISPSLTGLAVKFETTLLGLMASMISSFSLTFLEKREAELAAACMLIVKEARDRDV
jgi:hypothetical protein